ncbi:EamA family transporter [Halobacillus shinanisalinarum]|uniref:EamA family transporter n=1 Tax=Halobacillus shinanisalinarum TaxID=2932258 RepID=A0ABY4H1W9_9BACI|nr:EamA family transporter [Halobacillus shinanisalinarum]UOQ94435.1 EamA family transporter [Halobacillus shinanisalinarum]
MIKWGLLIMVFTLLGAIGGYFFKKATSHGFSINGYVMKNLIIGGSFYGIGAILNIITLNYLPYTIVFPLTSITYVWTMLISYIFLSELISMKKIIGLLFIVIGSFLLVT